MARSVLLLAAVLVCPPVSALAAPALLDVQAVGRTNGLRSFEPNGARHLARDRLGRVHLVFTDGEHVFYRSGAPGGDGRVSFEEATRVSDEGSRVLVFEHVGMPAPRGAVMALHEDGALVVVHVAWVGPGRDLYYRRLELGAAGSGWDEIVETGLEGLLPVMEVTGEGAVHLLAEHAFVEAGDVSEIRYASSRDGVEWTTGVVERADATSSRNVRLLCSAVDARDRLHVVFQAEGYERNGGASGATWWAARHRVRRDGSFHELPGPLEAFPAWGPPPEGRAVLFAYCGLAVDAAGNLHLAWHGTARSGAFGLDDVFYSASAYDAATDSFAPWTEPLALHRRVHDDVPGGPIEAGGEDEMLSWCPSLATDPSNGAVHAVVMFGPFDDEIGPDDTSAVTEAGLLSFEGGAWSPDVLNLSASPGERNWYPNAAARPGCSADRRVLDVLWVEGVQDPADPWAPRYEVAHALVDLGEARGGCPAVEPGDGGPGDGGPGDGGPSDGGVDAEPEAGEPARGCGGCASGPGPAPAAPLARLVRLLGRLTGL